MKPYYEHAGITIYHGDCREILPGLGTFDLVLTDPPYGIGHAWQGGSGHGWGKASAKAEIRNEWDRAPADVSPLLALGIPAVIWGGNYFPLPPSRGWLVWRKEVNPGFTLADAELAWSNRDAVIRVFDHPRSKLTGRLVPEHPTAKPVALMRWCLGFFPEARTVIDPYMGSGPVARACKDAGKQYVGIEIEERYAEIAAKRLAQEVLFA